MIMQQANAGWLFYKDYYRDIDFRAKKDDADIEQRFQDKNKVLFSRKFDPVCLDAFARSEQALRFETTYPGLLIGSGYNHETGFLGEIKIGFHFDHTTGMPYLPGSSVKGTLRAPFEKKDGVYRYLPYLKHLFREELGKPADPAWLTTLEVEIFEGANRTNMYQHDVFLDALITRGNAQGYFLDGDFITPHRKPGLLQNPIPIQFLKIRPKVEITFYFELKDGEILSGGEKLKLFRRILLDLGVGAKTNVGYGTLTDSM